MTDTINLSDDNMKNIVKYVEFMKMNMISKNKEMDRPMKPITHTLMGPLHNKIASHMGSFSIQGKNYNIFLKLYKQVMGKIPLYVVERPIQTGTMVGPLIIDVDYKTINDERVYDIILIESIIKICNEYFMKYLDIDKNEIVAYVQEKNEPTFDKVHKKYKDGFHIFYDIPLRYNKRKFLFDLIRGRIEKEDLFKNIDTDSTYKEIIDEHVLIDNGVLMFGSTKKERGPYELTYVYAWNLEELPLNEYMDNDNLVDIFSLRKYTDNDDTLFKSKYADEEEIVNNTEYIKKKIKNTEKVNNKVISNSKNETNKIDLTKLTEDHLMVYDLVNIMTTARAREYDSWIRVGWALHNISPTLYNVFLYFSRKAPNYDESSCERVWGNANIMKSGLTISSIKWWAREDNEDEYKRIMYKRVLRVLQLINQPNDNDVADFIKELYGDIYKCSDIKHNYWYEFQDHRWVFVQEGYTLLERIANDVADEFLKGLSYLSNEMNKTENGRKDDASKKVIMLGETIKKLKDQKTGATLLKTCARKMYDKKFEESLDSNPYLIGFDNGVLDLRPPILRKSNNLVKANVSFGAGIFRKGMPDDRLTMNVGYDYPEKTPRREILKEIENCIEKIQPEKAMREYIYRYFASCLDGKNRDQAFRIFTGSGGNGKSVLIKLFELSLGEYYCILPPCVLTLKNRGPNDANSFLAITKGKRATGIYETDNDSVIQLGIMKGLTGSDLVTTRKLYGDPFQFTPQFKLFLVCNRLPKIPSNDGGTWRRIRVTPFESKFVIQDQVDESKHMYLMDPNLDGEKLKEWASTFMWMLINIYYPRYIEDGLREPDKVRFYSDKYQQDSDVLYEFLKDALIETHDDNDSIQTVELFKQFKVWYKGNHNFHVNHNIDFAKKDLEEYLADKRELRVDNSIVYGIRSKFDENAL